MQVKRVPDQWWTFTQPFGVKYKFLEILVKLFLLQPVTWPLRVRIGIISSKCMKDEPVCFPLPTNRQETASNAVSMWQISSMVRANSTHHSHG